MTNPIHDHFRNVRRQEQDGHLPRVLHPIDNEDIKLLILENISQDAVDAFKAQGFHVDHYTRAMPEDELVEKIGSYHGIGIRSKTKITARVVQAAKKVSCRLF
jgi:D-3-phosphoglycerate dehydrogenase / 2-oxoglutarate reductase